MGQSQVKSSAEWKEYRSNIQRYQYDGIALYSKILDRYTGMWGRSSAQYKSWVSSNMSDEYRSESTYLNGTGAKEQSISDVHGAFEYFYNNNYRCKVLKVLSYDSGNHSAEVKWILKSTSQGKSYYFTCSTIFNHYYKLMKYTKYVQIEGESVRAYDF